MKYHYRHISQRFATDWADVVTASVCLAQWIRERYYILIFPQTNFPLITYKFGAKHEQEQKEKRSRKKEKRTKHQTWKQAECM